MALDIDVDYFVRPDDSLWSSPESLAQELQGLTVGILTVATSLEGGYTPANLHGLGQDCLRCFGFPQHPFPLYYPPQPEACAPGPVRFYLESIVQARLKNPDRVHACLLQLEQSVLLTCRIRFKTVHISPEIRFNLVHRPQLLLVG